MTDFNLIMRRILNSNAAITSLLGKKKNSSTPLICTGLIPEFEKAVPALRVIRETGLPSVTQQLRYYRIDCYAIENDISDLVAETIVSELNGKDHDIGVMINCSLLSPISDPNSKEVNTPIEIRLIKIGGA